jgi:hypothetical protein
VDFQERLKSAIQRGQKRGVSEENQLRQQQMSEQEMRSRHTDFRLQLSDYIEHGLRTLPEHFPGFRFETIYGERGWGGAIYRDDLTKDKTSGRGGSFYSRLEITVRPYSDYRIVDISVKGTVQNKELLSKNYYEEIQAADLDSFKQKIDSWIVQYAELYAAA